ncbi:MAG TPA: GNAT family N-acetyltransferase [Labilithrix sp.]|nr:GNAT family N-acetyltransferase [Labilithrix sp.]
MSDRVVIDERRTPSPVMRPARSDDAAAIASVHIASSDDAYAPLAGTWPQADHSARTALWAESLSGRTFVLVAEDTDGAVIGFVSGGAARRPETAVELELYVIHVLPGHRNRGVGSALWRAACRDLRGVELAPMYLDTLAELACSSFYERHGGEVVERRPMDFHGAERTHVTYRWSQGASSEAIDSPTR